MNQRIDKYINKITLADCMDIMKGMPDKCIDLAIVDPPYGIGDFKQKASRKIHKKIEWNNEIPPVKYFNELKRVSKNQIIWGANYYNLPGGRIIHDKLDAGKHKTYKEQSEADIAYHSFGVNIKIYRYTWKGNMQGNKINWNNSGIDGRIHPCQKPVALYQWLLQNYAKEGSLILDTHSGSGSCAIACHLEGFNFIAIEKDTDYHRDSVKRLEEIRSQGRLFT